MYSDLLAQTPLFKDLSGRELSWLADACRERECVPGEVLVPQGGASGAGLIIVLAGALQVSRESAGEERPLATLLCAGDLIGEDSLLEEKPSPATITALEPSTVLTLPIWAFRAVMRELPDLAIHLLAILAHELSESPKDHVRQVALDRRAVVHRGHDVTSDF
jgi:CRP-like cAMP-binding protein